MYCALGGRAAPAIPALPPGGAERARGLGPPASVLWQRVASAAPGSALAVASSRKPARAWQGRPWPAGLFSGLPWRAGLCAQSRSAPPPPRPCVPRGTHTTLPLAPQTQTQPSDAGIVGPWSPGGAECMCLGAQGIPWAGWEVGAKLRGRGLHGRAAPTWVAGAARLRDPWARPAVLRCPSRRGSWLAQRLWPQEETRPPSWQAQHLEAGSRTREWKNASLKLRLFFLAIPEVDAAREVVWLGRGEAPRGAQTCARHGRPPPGLRSRSSHPAPPPAPGAGHP